MPVLNKNNYRNPILLQLNSENSTETGEFDGQKSWLLEKSINIARNEYMLIHLRSAIIPYSFYVLSDKNENNKLDILETDIYGGTNTLNLTIPDGNYVATTLADTLEELINENSTFNSTWDFFYNQDTNHFEIKCKAGLDLASATFQFGTGANKDKSIRIFLGFTADNISVNVANTIESNKNVDMTGGVSDGVHIQTNLGATNLLVDNGKLNTEITVVPINVNPFDLIYYENNNVPFKMAIPTRELKSIEIKLTDRLNRVLDFNGIPYTLFLEIDFMYYEEESLRIRGNEEQIKKNEKLNQIKTLEQEALLNNIQQNKKNKQLINNVNQTNTPAV